jgi:DNA-binding transcriptional LysR family regulator
VLDPRLLQSFVVLAEELHFGRAAEQLSIAQPGLSQQINRLERQVSAQLFTRSSRAVELTDAGRAMLEPARAAVRAAEQAERASREAARTSEHPLRVGIPFWLEDVVPTVAAYASGHAELQLWISRMYEPHAHEMLAAGLLDAVVGFLAPDEGSHISRVRALDVPIVALAAPSHPLARQPAVTLREFSAFPIATLARADAPNQFDFFVDVFSEGEGRERLSMREFRYTGTGPHPGILEAIGAGEAVGFGTPASLAVRSGHLRLLPFAPSLAMPTHLSWHAGRSAIIDGFVERMRVQNQPEMT